MKKFILVFILLLILNPVSAEPTQEALSLQESFVKVSKDVGPAVVSISAEHTERYSTRYYPFARFRDDFFDDFFEDFFVAGPDREFKRLGLGSGVIIDKEGYILTNEHVIYGADKITVTLPDGREFKGSLTGSDVQSDLAVVKIASETDLPFAELGDSDDVKIGHWAIAIGNPFAFAVKNPEPTLTVGVVSALGRSLPRTDKRAREYSDLIQTDAAINPGNSGGPLVNIRGEVIGINVAILGGAEGIGFAVPVNTAKKIISDLMQGRKVLYGWIGVMIQDVDSDLVKYFGLKDKKGVLVSRILEQSPAEKAGLAAGDIITSFDGIGVRNTQDLIRRVLKKDIGEKAELGVIRGGRPYSFDVEIGTRPEEETLLAHEKKESPSGTVELKYWRGLEVSDATEELRTRFKLTLDKGVVVVQVETSSPAEEAGIRIGDVIYEIDRVPINNMKDYTDAIKNISGDVLVGTYRGYVVVKEK